MDLDINIYDQINISESPTVAHLNSRHWVGGSIVWSGIAGTKWAYTSGGTGGVAVPTSADNVYFDANSGAVTVSLSSTNTYESCASIDFTGYTGSFGGTTTGLYVYNNLTLSATMSFSYTGTITMKATATGMNITSNGKAMTCGITFDGTGGEWTLQDNLSIGISKNITLTRGSLITNGKTVTAFILSLSNSNVRSLTLGASAINCYWSASTTTNLTFDSGTSTITTNTNGGAGSIFSGGGLTYYNVEVKPAGNGVEHSLYGSNTYNSLTITGANNKSCVLRISGTHTATTMALNGYSDSARLMLTGVYFEGQWTMHVDAINLTAQYLDLQEAVSTHAINLTAITGGCGNLGYTSNITLSGAKTRYWMATSGGNWSDTTSWSTASNGATGASIPLAQDTVVFDQYSITSASSTITVDHYVMGASVNFTGVLNNPNLAFTNVISDGTKIRGVFTMISGMTVTPGAYGIDMIARNDWNFTTGDVVFDIPITIHGSDFSLYKVTQIGDLTTGPTKTFALRSGWYDVNGYDLTIGKFLSTVSVPGSVIYNTRRLYMGEGTIELTGTGDVWNCITTDLTITEETSTIKITDTSSSTKTFTGASEAYYNIWLAGTGVGSYHFVGNNTFIDFKDDNSSNHAIKFTAGSNTTVTTFTVNGSATNTITIGSITSANYTLTKTGGSTITADYVNVSYSTASPTSTWYGGIHATNGGNNPNWLWGPSMTNPANIYADDNVYTTVGSTDGILYVSLSGDAGVSYCVPLSKTFGAAETEETYGAGSTELWGLSWKGTAFTNTNFRVKLQGTDAALYQNVYKTFGYTVPASANLAGIEVKVRGKWDGATMSLDLLTIKLYYGGSVLPVQEGSQAFASNGRKNGEGAGAGTGVLVYFDGEDWRATDTGATVAA